MTRSIQQLFTACIILSSFASAQWLQTGGPYGASVYSLTTAGSTVLSATLSGIYRTTNDGVTWSRSSGIPDNANILNLIHGTGGIYAATSAGPYVSTNAGVTWESFDSAQVTGYNTASIGLNTRLFAGTFQGVYRSTNGGKNWSGRDTVIGTREVKTFFVVGSMLFAGTSSGLFRSTNEGTTWKNADTLVTNAAVTRSVMVGTKLYISSYSGVYVSPDTGRTWANVKGHQVSQIIYSLTTDGVNLYAGTSSDGVYYSSNGGDTWSKLGALPALAVNALTMRGSNVIAGHNWGISLSTNSGTTWADMNTGITGTGVTFLGRTNGEFTAVSTSSGIFSSINSGLTWNPNPNSVKNAIYYTFFADTTAYRIGANTGLFLSTDAGLSWKLDTAGFGSYNVAYSFAKNGNLFAATQKGVYERVGNVWTLRNSGLPVNPQVRLLRVVNGNLYAAVNDSGLFRSSNKGVTWNYVGSGIHPKTEIHDMVSFGGVIYAGTAATAYVSTNGGSSWRTRSIGLPGSATALLAVNGNLFTGSYGFGAYVIKAKDTVWTSVNSGLPVANIYSLYTENNTLFAGTNSGVWKRPLNEMVTSVRQNTAGAPGEFALNQNYPNPFNPTTTMGFTLRVSGITSLKIYDALGREVSTLVNEHLEAGVYHQRTFNASHLSSGVYFARLTSGGASQMQKMMLVK